MPTALPENLETLAIADQFSFILVDGSGGISADGIKLAMELYGIPEERRAKTARKLAAYINEIISIKQKEAREKMRH